MWVDYKLTNSSGDQFEELMNFDHMIRLQVMEASDGFLLLAVGTHDTPNVVLYSDKNKEAVIMMQSKIKKAFQAKQLIRLEEGYIQSL